MHSLSVIEADTDKLTPIFNKIDSAIRRQSLETYMSEVANVRVMKDYAALLANGPALNWFKGKDLRRIRKLFKSYDMQVWEGKHCHAKNGWVDLN